MRRAFGREPNRTVTYTKTEALSIFSQPVNGNGLVSLAHQLLAAKLNVASGASNTVVSEIAQADTVIGGLVVPPVVTGYLATSATSGLAQALDDYNTGATGPGHCDGVGKPECACGDGVVHAPESATTATRSTAMVARRSAASKACSSVSTSPRSSNDRART